ncbi:MAG: glyoxylate/hydroxypyruvate reductase A [Weeksellaceae bacterium]|nr:glyoxylate/hydroxypyruvate reductase A [Weeksellaceae bacterium]
MSVAILFNQKSTEEWFLKLKESMPNVKIEVYPDIENYNEIEFLVTWKPHVNYVNEFPNLKVVQSVGAGVDNLLHTVLDGDVLVTRIVDSTLKQDMYEHVLACIMASMKNIIPYYKEQKLKNWSPKKYLTISESTVTILGLGEIGSFVAEKLVALGFQVKGWSNSEKNLDKIQSFVGINQLDEAISNSDFIVNILPLTDLTQNILNQSFFNKLSDNTTIINVGRGAHLVEEDLIAAIDSGKVKEAYLDVFREEPLDKNHLFWENLSIYVTPHIASITNPNTAINQVVENINRFLEDKELLNVVDLKRGY